MIYRVEVQVTNEQELAEVMNALTAEVGGKILETVEVKPVF